MIEMMNPDAQLENKYKTTDTLSPMASWKDKLSYTNFETIYDDFCV